MSPPCVCCGEHVTKLQQQVSVMRKEIKNLRHMLDSAVKANRKHMTSIQSAVTRTVSLCGTDGQQDHSSTKPSSEPLLSSPSKPATHQQAAAALEKGCIQTLPIGCITSCFSVKTGTPRQPTVCGASKARLQIRQSIFNNPQHALIGLEQYSHVWVIFLFHKNGHLSYKAKVSPPRLNGGRVGVYSTRSPHRPNAIGLTLAKLDHIQGDTIHLSGIDMIDGTPVLDIKPYISDYDSPLTRMNIHTGPPDSHTDLTQETNVALNDTTDTLNLHKDSETDAELELNREITTSDDHMEDLNSAADFPVQDPSRVVFSIPKDVHEILKDVKTFVTQRDPSQLSRESEAEVSERNRTREEEEDPREDHVRYGAEEAYSSMAAWVREPPVGRLEVRFTPSAERELAQFLPAHTSGASESGGTRFQFLRGPQEAAEAIRGVLSADPRSVYRRARCPDRLFFFSLDRAHVTCWFGPDFAEVLRVTPVAMETTPQAP